MPFEKLANKKKSTHVIEQILRNLKEGTYKKGDKLPPEQVLAKKTGVSRPTVREAFVALRLMRIVKSVPGNGTYIQKSIEDINAQPQVSTLLLEEEVNPFEKLKARRVLEEGIAKFAAEQATSEDLEKMDKILHKMEATIESEDYDEYLLLNRDFHLAIGEATHNEAIKHTIHFLMSFTDREWWKEMRNEFYTSHPNHAKRALELHQQIFTAIKNKDPQLICKAIQGHFNRAGLLRM